MIESNSPTKLFTAKRVSEHIGLSVATIYRLMADGEFPKPHNVGRRVLWRSDDVADWIEQTAPRRAANGTSD